MHILFVCLGNICRSPLAEGILRDKLSDQPHIIIDSAGTGNWHSGEPPDQRSIATALEFGIDIRSQRARQVVEADFERFDLILAMDEQNRLDLLKIAPAYTTHKIHRILDFAGMGNEGVPDPWFGALSGFRDVYQLLDQACEGLRERILRS